MTPRERKIQLLRAIEAGLSIETALKASNFSVLFEKPDCFTTGLDGGERISLEDGKLLCKYLPYLTSPIKGITFESE